MFQSTGLALNFSTPSRLTTRREIVALLRGPMPAPTVYLGTDDFLRLGQWHAPALAKLPEPSDARKNDFGMQESGAFSVEVAAQGGVLRTVTNLLADSEGFGGANWARIDTTYNAGTKALTSTASGNGSRVLSSPLATRPQTAHLIYSVLAAAGNVASMSLLIYDNTAAAVLASLNLGLSATPLRYQIELTGVVPGNWLNFYVYVKNTSGGAPGEYILLYNAMAEDAPIGAAAASEYVANGGSQVFDFPNRNTVFANTLTEITYPALGTRRYSALKNQPVDLDLLTRTYREDGTTVDFINERRGVVKSITRKRSGIELAIVDIDRVALKTLYPLHTFTLVDWPLLFADHVNRAVPNGVGTGEKIPCTYVDNTVGAYKYAVCEIRAGLAAPAVLTVYRGKASGQGQIVSPAEYAVSTATVAGVNYLLLTFTREQVDFDNQKFIIEADVLAAGSRLAADEIAALLQAIGLTIDASDFADASAYHALINARIDAWYTKQITADSILAPLMEAGRCWLAQAVGGAYSLAVDRPRAPQRVLWDDSDQIQIDSRREPEVAKTITLQYRPRPANRNEMAGDLSRTTTGASGEKIFKNEFVRDHDVADALLCYLTLKEQRADIEGTVYGVSLQPGELLAVNSALVFDGWKTLAAPSISRPAGANRCTFEEYSETDYLYTPGTLPADATNAYSPDYSYTPPVAPTALAVISQGITVDVDGKGLAYALIRAVPPTVNWQKLTAQIRNTVTNEIYQAQLTLSGGNYEAVIPGLRPNVAHQVIAWATNANAIDGVTAAAVAFTSANYTGAPSAPTALAANQTGADQIEVKFTPSASGSVVTGYIPYMQIGAGAFVAQPAIEGASYKQNISYSNFGTAITFKFKAVDRFGNQSADSGTVAITPSAYLGDGYINPLGINGGSLGTNSITGPKITAGEVYQNKLKSTNTSTTYTVAAGGTQNFYWGTFACGQWIASANQFDFSVHPGITGSPFAAAFAVKNNAGVSRDVTFGYYEIEL